MATGQELGEQFNLREANPDAGGGILYALRYDPEMIALKKAQTLDAIHSLGWTFFEVDQGSMGLKTVDQSDELGSTDQVFALAEELSVISDAEHYQSYGWGIEQRSVADLIRALSSHIGNATEQLGTRTTESKIEAFDLATLYIPSILQELHYADMQNNVLTARERQGLRNLEASTRFLSRIVDGRHIMIGR